ncbi:hypothetical protein EVJ58_g1117 [Rhodofomes roseus]|uniref:Uncharacterized protein n=1 Tax=Rhodofomes roseus TaxID=34475 RepID=A0A4Y9Z0B1_9APHY|nr:hypothetical protein EVJ58_g1117 [Rhodofomes roseus]
MRDGGVEEQDEDMVANLSGGEEAAPSSFEQGVGLMHHAQTPAATPAHVMAATAIAPAATTAIGTAMREKQTDIPD